MARSERVNHSKITGGVDASMPRRDILFRLLERGPSSVKEIASELGRPADALYYHFRLLLRQGLIQKHESRQTSRRDEAVYAVVESDLDDRRNAVQTLLVAESLLRAAGKEFTQSREHTKANSERGMISRHAVRRTAWLTLDELQKVERLLSSVEEIFRHGAKRDDAHLYSFTHVITPLKTHPIRR